MNMRNIFVVAFVASAMASPAAFALPGAHGPNGEHLDAPSAGGSSAPRIEAKSETFELVGQLRGGELSILINRFETNEPVLGASVDVESGNLKAKANFHADHGDYAVSDEAFLKSVSRPGAHPLVVTVAAGSDADLLDGMLNIPQEARDGDHDHHGPHWGTWALGAAGAVVVGAVLWRFLRRRTPSMTSAGRAA